MSRLAKSFYGRHGKRILDLAITMLSLPLLLPIMLVVALAARITLGSPVLFRQVRPGLWGRPFTLYKFRTMTEARDSEGRLLPDAERLLALGVFLRRTSLDELPSIWNILRGDMSWIGPRPLLMEYLPRYTPSQARRHEVRPGLTGWAQIHGRQDIPFSQRLALDLWYVNHGSCLVDLKILAMTVLVVAGMNGVRPGQDVREVDDVGLSSSHTSKGHSEGGVGTDANYS